MVLSNLAASFFLLKLHLTEGFSYSARTVVMEMSVEIQMSECQ